jgi:hypothetical protein
MRSWITPAWSSLTSTSGTSGLMLQVPACTGITVTLHKTTGLPLADHHDAAKSR